MDGEEAHTEPCDLRGRALDRVRDVVQLEVDEHLLALSDEALTSARPARIDKLHADLVEDAGIADARDEPLAPPRPRRYRAR